MHGQTTYYLYDQAGQLLAELDDSGQTQVEYVWLDTQPLAVIHTNSSDAGIYYIHNDHHNTPQVVSDSQGNRVLQANYSPFGQASIAAGSTLTFNLRFPGPYFDVETGLHYNYYRVYDPATGRYIQADPIGLGGGLNTYGYGYGYQNPTNYIDPEGTFAFVIVWPLISGSSATGLSFWSTGALIGGALAVASIPQDSPIEQLARQSEYERAKFFCDTPEPPGHNNCSTLSKKIDHAKKCINLYEDLDSKWN